MVVVVVVVVVFSTQILKPRSPISWSGLRHKHSNTVQQKRAAIIEEAVGGLVEPVGLLERTKYFQCAYLSILALNSRFPFGRT